MNTPIRSFECYVKGRPHWAQLVNSTTAGKAKTEYWRQVSDAWPDIPFTDIRCKRHGPPHTSAAFVRNAEYRGMPGLKCGQRVAAGESKGWIVGHDCSCNMLVQFDSDDPKYPGLKLSVHPDELTL